MPRVGVSSKMLLFNGHADRFCDHSAELPEARCHGVPNWAGAIIIFLDGAKHDTAAGHVAVFQPVKPVVQECFNSWEAVGLPKGGHYHGGLESFLGVLQRCDL